MNKYTYFKYVVFLLLGNTCQSCVIGIGKTCQSFIPQQYKFGDYPINVDARKTTLQVGDTVFLTVKIDPQFYDSLSRQSVMIDHKVTLFIKVSSAASPLDPTNVFQVDTTIYHVFDQYFTTRVLKGTKNTAYLFDCQWTNGFWQLELQYIPLRKGTFDLSASFSKIQLSQVALSEEVCMLGDMDTFGAQVRLQTVNNQIKRVYPTLASPPNRFGFIVE
ncbi:hypothetical protein GCM10028808_09080 [Spirosoma migulaei]